MIALIRLASLLAALFCFCLAATAVNVSGVVLVPLGLALVTFALILGTSAEDLPRPPR